jgi:hypothetical protein
LRRLLHPNDFGNRIESFFQSVQLFEQNLKKLGMFLGQIFEAFNSIDGRGDVVDRLHRQRSRYAREHDVCRL